MCSIMLMRITIYKYKNRNYTCFSNNLVKMKRCVRCNTFIQYAKFHLNRSSGYKDIDWRTSKLCFAFSQNFKNCTYLVIILSHSITSHLRSELGNLIGNTPAVDNVKSLVQFQWVVYPCIVSDTFELLGIFGFQEIQSRDKSLKKYWQKAGTVSK